MPSPISRMTLRALPPWMACLATDVRSGWASDATATEGTATITAAAAARIRRFIYRHSAVSMGVETEVIRRKWPGGGGSGQPGRRTSKQQPPSTFFARAAAAFQDHPSVARPQTGRPFPLEHLEVDLGRKKRYAGNAVIRRLDYERRGLRPDLYPDSSLVLDQPRWCPDRPGAVPEQANPSQGGGAKPGASPTGGSPAAEGVRKRMRYRPIRAASPERVPLKLWAPSRARTALAAVAAAAAALVPTVMVASPAQAAPSDYLSISDAGNWDGGTSGSR